METQVQEQSQGASSKDSVDERLALAERNANTKANTYPAVPKLTTIRPPRKRQTHPVFNIPDTTAPSATDTAYEGPSTEQLKTAESHQIDSPNLAPRPVVKAKEHEDRELKAPCETAHTTQTATPSPPPLPFLKTEEDEDYELIHTQTLPRNNFPHRGRKRAATHSPVVLSESDSPETSQKDQSSLNAGPTSSTSKPAQSDDQPALRCVEEHSLNIETAISESNPGSPAVAGISSANSNSSEHHNNTSADFEDSSTTDPYLESEMDRRLRESKPRLLLMGQRRSGKSSITSVVFHKIPPQETIFLETTPQLQKDTMHSFMDFHIWDLPGQIDYYDPAFDTNEIFSHIGALVWVVDAQDDYNESLNRLTTTILNLQNTYPQVNVEVLIHKTDSLNDEYRTEVREDIIQRVGDELSDQGYIHPNVSYHLTSIYDYTIFEALSKIVQKLIPTLDTLQNLMNNLVERTGMAKAYLFDTLTKVYVCSDTRPDDQDVFNSCADYIDVIVDMSDLFGHERNEDLALGAAVEETESSMQIHDGSTVYLKEMNRFLCLVFAIKNPAAKDKRGLIDHNCYAFQEAMNEVLARGWDRGRLSNGGEATEGGDAGAGVATI